MSGDGVKEMEGLQMIKVTSERAQKWGAELHQVVRRRDDREEFATMGLVADEGAQELFRGYEKGREFEDIDLNRRAGVVAENTGRREMMAKSPAIFKKFDEADLGYGAPSLVGEWSGEVEIPELGVYGLGVRLGEIDRAERGTKFFGRLHAISTERGLMGEYRRQLEEANHPELLKVLDAILVGIKEGGKKNG